MELTEAQRGACQAIEKSPEPWAKRRDVEAGHGAETVAELEAVGVVAPWARPDHPAVTFTPIGAHRLGLVLRERWTPATEDREEQVGPLSVVKRTERVMVEMPNWVGRAFDPKTGDPVPVDGNVVLPRHARIGTTIARLDRIEAPPAPEPEFLTDQEGEQVRLFAAGGVGVPVRIDRRLLRRGPRRQPTRGLDRPNREARSPSDR